MSAAVGIALVGTGFGLRTQLPVLRQIPGAAVRALVGREAARTADLARRHEIPFASDQLAAVLSRDDIDLVCISTPPDLHLSMSEAALAAGKAVLCEKPMALDAHQAAAMAAAARRAGKPALIDHQLRFAPSFRRLRRLISEGYIGTPLHAEVVIAHDRWLDPLLPMTWWQERARGGGALGAFGSHAVDWLRWMFGDVEAVLGDLRTCIATRPATGELRPRPVDSDDDTVALVRLRGTPPIHATLRLSVVMHRGPGLRLGVHGTEGVLLCDDEGRLWGSHREPAGGDAAPPLEPLGEPEGLSSAVLKVIPDSLWSRAFYHLARVVVEALGSQSAVVAGAASFEDGLAVQRVLDAVRQSDAEGRWVEVPAGD
jgi:predicted dehydrogenase